MIILYQIQTRCIHKTENLYHVAVLFRRANMRKEIMIQTQIGLIRWINRLKPRQPQNHTTFMWQKLVEVSNHVYMSLQITIYHCYVINMGEAVREKMMCLVPWINHLPPVCWSTFGILVWNDSGYVNLTQWWYFFIIFEYILHISTPHIMIFCFPLPYFPLSTSALFFA